MLDTPSRTLSGSSPRTRGAPRRCRVGAQARRDHPRVRGEHLHDARPAVRAVGIIPAYAGSTEKGSLGSEPIRGSSPRTRGALACCRALRCRTWDHPRVRGEHETIAELRRRVHGIIPAYAGSTLIWPLSDRTSWGSSPRTRGALLKVRATRVASRDHPRVRGEHVSVVAHVLHGHGIIPAYAGSTPAMPSALMWSTGSSPRTRGARCNRCRTCESSRDHPRVRGEHQHDFEVEAVEPGIIPAYAGSTLVLGEAAIRPSGSSPRTRGAPSPRTAFPSAPWDHPRVRGEH